MSENALHAWRSYTTRISLEDEPSIKSDTTKYVTYALGRLPKACNEGVFTDEIDPLSTNAKRS